MAAQTVASSVLRVACKAPTVAKSTKVVALSSRNAGFAPMQASLKMTPAVQRLVNLVIEAKSEAEIPAAAKPLIATAVANVLMASPAMAGELFDFNLTLPIIMGQYLVLMVILDKLIFAPVGEVLDNRDSELRSKLVAVKDNSSELDALAEEAAAILKAARADAQEAIQSAKSKTEKECAEKLSTANNKMQKELATALSNLEKQKQESLGNLDAQVEALASEIVKKVLPA
ncbi:hypothetical protein CYMTET_25257 [Cymbomonas tetramitiformis]|uniref:ATP synthase subunit b', chloroplastic n=1 Tax=Cymbomonas tetramitiformis TaxID=36881 RepID=A0AAE0FUH9_9CHLO|nr:hypothetical protein CYMTET_25257 [Cymbomonas tetramitiformis]|eukprot:gene26261-32188_t